MSESNIHVVMDRIRSASRESPIAVFKTPLGYDSIFAATVGAQRRIQGDSTYIGTFSCLDDPGRVRARLRSCTGGRIDMIDVLRGIRL